MKMINQQRVKIWFKRRNKKAIQAKKKIQMLAKERLESISSFTKVPPVVFDKFAIEYVVKVDVDMDQFERITPATVTKPLRNIITEELLSKEELRYEWDEFIPDIGFMPIIQIQWDGSLLTILTEI